MTDNTNLPPTRIEVFKDDSKKWRSENFDDFIGSSPFQPGKYTENSTFKWRSL